MPGEDNDSIVTAHRLVTGLVSRPKGWARTGVLSLALFAASAFSGAALIPVPRTASADSYESFVTYVRDYSSQKAYRSTKVTPGGWHQLWNAWSFYTFTVEGYANIMLSTYQYHYAVHTRNTSMWPEDRRYMAWDLDYYNTPSYVPQEYYDLIPTDGGASVLLLTGTSKNQNTLFSPFDCAWAEVTAPNHTSNLYGSGSGISTSSPK